LIFDQRADFGSVRELNRNAPLRRRDLALKQRNAEILRIRDIDTASSTMKHFQAKWIAGSREENA
jgi:hypothetical protein